MPFEHRKIIARSILRMTTALKQVVKSSLDEQPVFIKVYNVDLNMVQESMDDFQVGHPSQIVVGSFFYMHQFAKRQQENEAREGTLVLVCV